MNSRSFHLIIATLISGICWVSGSDAADVIQGSVTLNAPQQMTIDLTLNDLTQLADIVLTGPDNMWFSVGFDSTVDANTYAIVVEGGGVVQERKLGDHNAGTRLTSTVSQISSTVNSGIRNLHLQRDLVGADSNYHTFTAAPQSLDLIWAYGSGPNFSFHQDKGSIPITLSLVPEPTSAGILAAALTSLFTVRRRRVRQFGGCRTGK